MRTTVVIPTDLKERARRMATDRGVSFGQLVREALEEKLNNHRPKPRGGLFASGYTDTGRLSGEIRPVPRSWR